MAQHITSTVDLETALLPDSVSLAEFSATCYGPTKGLYSTMLVQMPLPGRRRRNQPVKRRTPPHGPCRRMYTPRSNSTDRRTAMNAARSTSIRPPVRRSAPASMRMELEMETPRLGTRARAAAAVFQLPYPARCDLAASHATRVRRARAGGRARTMSHTHNPPLLYYQGSTSFATAASSRRGCW